jgi:DNA polymerase-4
MILHIDMDAFYASVEQLDHPELRGKCVIVGGTGRRGVVSAASYEARRHGVHSAMPVFLAQKKCPHGIYIRPRISRYREISANVMSLLKRYSPLVEVVSIDEAYLDITGCSRTLGPVETTAAIIKDGIRRETELTCSVGAAPVRFLAKIASDMNKPDGLTIIQAADVPGFIQQLPIEKVPGVGSFCRRQLAAIGIRCLGDVNSYPAEMLERRLGKFGAKLILLAKGIDKTPVSPVHDPKSVSTELTLEQDTQDVFELKKILLSQSEKIARELRKMHLKSRTITLKIKHADFSLVTRRVTLPTPTHSAELIYRHAAALLDQYDFSHKIRLIGIGASSVIPATNPAQLPLFANGIAADQNWEKIDRALDDISRKFGDTVVRRAVLGRPCRDADDKSLK